MSLFQQLPSNPWAWSITVVIAVASFVTGYRSIAKKAIKCDLSSTEMIENRKPLFSKLNITYDKKQINKLTVTKITFWNDSFSTINNNDLAKTEPFKVVITNGEILDLEVIQGGISPNQIEVSQIDNNSAKILFEYLDQKEGGIVQVIHTGDKDSVGVSGTVKGGKIKIISGKRRSLLSTIFFGLLAGIITVFAFLPAFDLLDGISIGLSISATVIVMYPIYMRWIGNKKFVPKNCKKKK